jgi:uncharacterized membrane protein
MKWALGVSLAVNLFLIGGGVAATTVIHNHFREERHSTAGPAWDAVEAHLTPATRDHIRSVVKTAALGTEADWAHARELRKQAEDLAHQPDYDAARIVALAEQARSYENMSRARIETALIQDIATLPPDQRGVVAGYIMRPGFRLHRLLEPEHHGHDGHGPAPAADGAASK